MVRHRLFMIHRQPVYAVGMNLGKRLDPLQQYLVNCGALLVPLRCLVTSVQYSIFLLASAVVRYATAATTTKESLLQ